MRAIIILSACLLLSCFRRKLFKLRIVKRDMYSQEQSYVFGRGTFKIYVTLLVVAAIARALYAVSTNNNSFYQDNPLYAAPRPTAHSVKNYTNYLQANKQNINDYVMSLFEKYDHVILCERIHPEMTQYDMIYNLVTDERFVDKVGVVFTEIGNVNSRDSYQDLVRTDFPNDSTLDKALASFMMDNQTVHLLWANTNWFNFLRRMYCFNHRRELKVDILFADQDYPDRTELSDRDRIMADNIINTIHSDSLKKSLIIMNYRHAYLSSEGNWQNSVNCGYCIEQAFPGKVANVLINGCGFHFIEALMGLETMVPLKEGRWDRACEAVGDSAFAFGFEGSPFGTECFDHFCVPFAPIRRMLYQDVFTGYIFYKSPLEHYVYTGFNHLFDAQNVEKLKERERMLSQYGYSLSDYDYLKEGPVRWDLRDYYLEIYRQENLLYLGISLLAALIAIGMFVISRRR